MNLLFNSNKKENTPCVAHVTYSEDNSLGAVWEREHRGITTFAPKGIAYSPCEGDQLLLLPVDGADTCVGVRVSNKGLQPGELRLSSSGGAVIHLKNDGSISLNGLVISNQGVIV